MKPPTQTTGTVVSDPRVASLWDKLRQLRFDSGDGPRTFAARLASEQNWSEGFTDLAIQEYRRFLLLFALEQGRINGAQPGSGAATAIRIVPSAIVDRVWHLHLLYTQSYWEDLCRDVLGSPLHHVPADGSGGEAVHLDEVYRHTLEAYRAAFGQLAPPLVWPDPTPSQISLAETAAAGPEALLDSGEAKFTAFGWVLALLPMGAVIGLTFSGLKSPTEMISHVAASCAGVSVAVLIVYYVLKASATGSRTGHRRWGGRIVSASWPGSDGGFSGDGGGGYQGGDSHGHSGSGHICGGHSCGGHGCGGHGCGGGGH